MFQVYARSTAAAAFAPIKVGTEKGRKAISQATEAQIVTVLASKDSLARHASRINHYAGDTGVTASVTLNGDGEAVFTLIGLAPATAEAWVWLVARLAGRQEQKVTSLAIERYPSKRAQQFTAQFLPSCTERGSAKSQNNAKAELLADDGYVKIILPIVVSAGWLKR